MKKSLSILMIGIVLALFLFAHAAQAKPRWPTQMGYVTFQLGDHGEGIGQITYPCKFSAPPVLIVSPAQGQGTFSVIQFQANSLTGEVGSVAVVGGSPGAEVTFAWVAGN